MGRLRSLGLPPGPTNYGYVGSRRVMTALRCSVDVASSAPRAIMPTGLHLSEQAPRRLRLPRQQRTRQCLQRRGGPDGSACSEHMSDGEVLVQADLRVQPHTSVFLDGASRYQEQPRIIGSPLAMGVDAIAALVALCVFKKWAQPRFLALGRRKGLPQLAVLGPLRVSPSGWGSARLSLQQPLAGR